MYRPRTLVGARVLTASSPNMAGKTSDFATRVSAVSSVPGPRKERALVRGPRCRVESMDTCARGTRKRTD
jgi:hypothetical protein